MLEIWGRKNSNNVIPVMWTVSELGLEHTRHNVGGSFGGLDTEDYGRINPNRTIPTINDDGFVLWESTPIVRYLSRRYGSGSLCPEDPEQAALADQWMEWFKANVFPSFIPIFFGLVRMPKEQSDPGKIADSGAHGGREVRDPGSPPGRTALRRGRQSQHGRHSHGGLGLQVLHPAHRAAVAAQRRSLVCTPVRA